MVLEGGALGGAGGEVSMSGRSTLRKKCQRDPERLPHVKTEPEGANCEPGSPPSPESNHAGNLILGFQPPQL